MRALDLRSGNTSSRVRTVEGANPRQRLRAFLAAQAPLDATTLGQLCDRLHAEAATDAADACIAHAQARLTRWSEEVLGPDGPTLDPEGIILRRALDRHPSALLSEDPDERRVLRDAWEQLSRRAELPRQRLDGPRPWWAIAPLLATALGVVAGLLLLEATTVSAWTVPWAVLFGVLVGLHGVALVLALLGVVRSLRPPRWEESEGPLPRTALVMPIYEEDPERVFAALAAMREALIATGEGDAFEIFVASDTQDPRRAADEMRAWRRLAIDASSRVPVFYRRRAANRGKKSGNLAELFVRHEARYRYAIVLDADSLMGGETIVRMVRRMEANPRLGLLQASIGLRGGKTLFARMLQLGHALAGPLMTRGLSAWSGADGNYFGHNAIVRVDAFVRCCGLPLLSGAPPLGGPILSHDFVEAALLRRGGYEVRLADDLIDSYEEPPPTLRDYLVRDRRWCQGNLQHLRVVLADGLPARSRLHLLLGAAAYLTSPLWLVFMALGGIALATTSARDTDLLLALGIGAFTLLLLPRALGVIWALGRARAFGGVARLLLGASVELVLSIVIAPITMLARTLFVVEIVTGKAVGWVPQRRDSSGALASLDGRTVTTSIVGAIGLALSTQLTHPWLLWPIVGPCALAVPLSLFLGSRGVSRAARAIGLFAIPEERRPTAIARDLESRRGYYHADSACRFRDLVLDPNLCARLRARLPEDDHVPDLLITKAIARGPAGLTPDEHETLLRSRRALEKLHREAWRHWNVEDWELPHGVRAEPVSHGEHPAVGTVG